MNPLKKKENLVRILIWLLPGFVLTALSPVVCPTAASAENIVIICNRNVPDTNPAPTEITKIFIGKKTRWQDGSRIRFAIMDHDDIHSAFLKQHVKKTPSQFRNYWRKKVFTGKGRSPKKVDTTDAMLRFVEETDGAVGYVPESAVSNRVKRLSE